CSRLARAKGKRSEVGNPEQTSAHSRIVHIVAKASSQYTNASRQHDGCEDQPCNRIWKPLSLHPVRLKISHIRNDPSDRPERQDEGKNLAGDEGESTRSFGRRHHRFLVTESPVETCCRGSS